MRHCKKIGKCYCGKVASACVLRHLCLCNGEKPVAASTEVHMYGHRSKERLKKRGIDSIRQGVKKREIIPHKSQKTG